MDNLIEQHNLGKHEGVEMEHEEFCPKCKEIRQSRVKRLTFNVGIGVDGKS